MAEATGLPVVAAAPPRTVRVARRLRRLPLVPLAILVAFTLLALFADVISPYPATENDLASARRPPFFMEGGDTRHLLGTDLLGRDILSRTIKGAQVSLGLAVTTIAISAFVGTLVGMIAGLRRGWLDLIAMRTVDAFLAFPLILLALVFSITIGPGFWSVVVVISLFLWARYARQIRGEVLSLVQRDFVALSRVAGVSDVRLMVAHLLPNLANTIVVISTLQVAYVILVEASLSFLGAGIPPPTPTWGGMVADGRLLLRDSWWMSVVPGCALAAVVLAVNLLGDWLRDALDPTLRQL